MYAPIRILVLLAVAVFACSTGAAQPMLYWSDATTNKIQRLDLAQSVVEDVVVAPLAGPGNIALDFERGHMYWSNTGRNMVVRANIDGSDVRQIMAGHLVSLDAGANKLYVVRDSTLHRANLDGSQGEVLLTMPGLTGSWYILPPVAIDLEAEKVYWVSWAPWDIDGVWIRRANLDGTEQELFFDEATGPGIATIVGLFVDTAGGKLYMQDALGVHNFHQVNLDGSGFKVLDHLCVHGIAVDSEQGKVYLVESDETCTRSYFLGRSNLDGSDRETLIPVEYDVTGVALDASNNVLVWISPSGIWRSQLDGSQVEQVVASNLNHPHGIRVDPAGGHIYWTNGRAIGRHGLDGLHEEILVDSLRRVEDVAIDLRNGFLYWALVDEGSSCPRGCDTGRIQRSRLNGSDVEEVVSLPHRPYALEVDVEHDRLFWTSTEGIFTARLDGSAMTRIASLGEPYDLELDVGRERIYWLDYTSERGHELGWISLDGSASEVLYEGGHALTVDALNGSVYWAGVDSEQGTIWRGSLNGGSEKELVAAGFGYIVSLAIDPAETSTHIATGEVPRGFDLGQNYPNPFNPTTTMAYTLARPSDVTLTVYDVLGRQVRVLVSATRPAGHYEVSFDATGLSSGLYFYRLRAGDYTETKRMAVVR